MKSRVNLQSISKCVLIASTLFATSAVVAVMLFNSARDVLALGKSREKTAEISITEIEELPKLLSDYGIIDHPMLFSIYVALKEPQDITTHKVTVNAAMDYRALLNSFVQ